MSDPRDRTRCPLCDGRLEEKTGGACMLTCGCGWRGPSRASPAGWYRMIGDWPRVGDRVRILDVVRSNVENGVTPWCPLPIGGGTVTEIALTMEDFRLDLYFGNKSPARVCVRWDEPGEVSAGHGAWRVGDLEPEGPTGS
jgi:hypothetical protein